MSQEETTVILRANSPAEAQVVVALLRAEGIETYVDGVKLQDEFAIAQRVMGLIGVEIEVGTQDATRALKLIEAAREDGQREDS